MNTIDLNKLQHFINQNDIPIIKGKPKTFLGIAKQPHYENVLSNIYAFYFDVLVIEFEAPLSTEFCFSDTEISCV